MFTSFCLSFFCLLVGSFTWSELTYVSFHLPAKCFAFLGPFVFSWNTWQWTALSGFIINFGTFGTCDLSSIFLYTASQLDSSFVNERQLPLIVFYYTRNVISQPMFLLRVKMSRFYTFKPLYGLANRSCFYLLAHLQLQAAFNDFKDEMRQALTMVGPMSLFSTMSMMSCTKQSDIWKETIAWLPSRGEMMRFVSVKTYNLEQISKPSFENIHNIVVLIKEN